jgi:ApaG protein|tara:strand:+ start:617 stop:1030 length:414 start_codon:yes stop_codon:yes gene_type:complete
MYIRINLTPGVMLNSKDKINIKVEPRYIQERSEPIRSIYFFAYHITVSNQGEKAAQLITRYWHITDGNGQVEEVRGPGVVGEQPRIAPGESFEYTSFCPLPTPFGVMKGSFQMLRDDGTDFDAPISPFRLVAPEMMN